MSTHLCLFWLFSHIGFWISFSLFNGNVSWVATFHTFFPPFIILPTFIILQVPFLLYTSCYSWAIQEEERKQVMNDENPLVPTQKKKTHWKRVCSLIDHGLYLSLSLNHKVNIYFFSQKFCEQKLFCLSKWLWLQTHSSWHGMCFTYIYRYVKMCHKNNSITKSWIFSQLFQEYHFLF